MNAAPARGEREMIRRNGSPVAFEPARIAIAMTKAFIGIHEATGGRHRGEFVNSGAPRGSMEADVSFGHLERLTMEPE